MGPLQPIHLAGPAPNTSTDRAGPRPRHSIRWSSHHLETFLAQATETDPMGYGVPSWVEKDLRAASRGLAGQRSRGGGFRLLPLARPGEFSSICSRSVRPIGMPPSPPGKRSDEEPSSSEPLKPA